LLTTLLSTLTTLLATLLTTLLGLSAAGFLVTTLTAWSLLTSALLATSLIVLTIVCHCLFPPIFEVNTKAVFKIENRLHFEPCWIFDPGSVKNETSYGESREAIQMPT